MDHRGFVSKITIILTCHITNLLLRFLSKPSSVTFQLTRIYHDRHQSLPVSIDNKTVWLGVEICINWWESIDTLLAVFTKLHVTCNSSASYPHMYFGKFSRLCAKWSARRPTFTGKFLAFRNACQARELHGFYLQQIIHTLLTEYSPKTRTFWEHSPEVFQVLIPAYDPPLE